MARIGSLVASLVLALMPATALAQGTYNPSDFRTANSTPQTLPSSRDRGGGDGSRIGATAATIGAGRKIYDNMAEGAKKKGFGIGRPKPGGAAVVDYFANPQTAHAPTTDKPYGTTTPYYGDGKRRKK